jgi:hypothetical protein
MEYQLNSTGIFYILTNDNAKLADETRWRIHQKQLRNNSKSHW